MRNKDAIFIRTHFFIHRFTVNTINVCSDYIHFHKIKIFQAMLLSLNGRKFFGPCTLSPKKPDLLRLLYSEFLPKVANKPMIH